MELYLSIPLALTVAAIVLIPALGGAVMGMMGGAFSGWQSVPGSFWAGYWRVLVLVGICLAVLWLIYGVILASLRLFGVL